MWSRVRAGLIALLVAVALSGCAGEAEGAVRTTTDGGHLVAQYVDLPDGRKVICVKNSGALQCDWGSAVVPSD